MSSTAERWASQAAAISCRFSKAKVWSIDFILKVWQAKNRGSYVGECMIDLWLKKLIWLLCRKEIVRE